MNEMVERVARAICAKRGIDPDAFAGDGEPQRIYSGIGSGYLIGETLSAWRYFIGDAFAAIEVMRKPTEAMCVAGQVDPFPISIEAAWPMMIDAALKD